MQKFFALLIVATVLLSLSACSDKPATADERDPATVYDGTGGLGGYSDPKYDYNSVDDSNTPSQTDDGSFGREASASLTIFSTSLRRLPASGWRGMRTVSVVPVTIASTSLRFCTR